jgi:hypothetical protein
VLDDEPHAPVEIAAAHEVRRLLRPVGADALLPGPLPAATAMMIIGRGGAEALVITCAPRCSVLCARCSVLCRPAWSTAGACS